METSEKRQTKLIVVFITLISLAEVIGLSSVVPVLMLAIDKSFLEKSSKLREVYNYFGFSSEGDFLLVFIGLIFVFYLAKNLFAIWLYKHIRKVSVRINKSITRKQYLQYFEKSNLDNHNKGTSDFVNKVLYDPLYFTTGVYFPFINIISEIIVVILITLIFTFYQPILLLLLAGLIGPMFYLVNHLTKNKLYKLGVDTSEYRRRTLAEMKLGPEGFMEIKAHQKEKYFLEKFLVPQQEYSKNSYRGITYQLIPARTNEMVLLIGIIILVIYGYFFSDNVGQIRVLAALFVLAIFRLIPATNRLLQGLMNLKMSFYTIDNLSENKNAVTENGFEEIAFEKNIEFRNVHFNYPGGAEQLLININFTIHKGSIVGLEGSSGSGKTTLVHMLSGMIAPAEGQILIDDKRLSNSNRNSWIKKVAYVSQNPFILNTDLYSNVAFGSNYSDIDFEKAQQCLKMASLDSLILQYGHKDACVGESGSKLSQGQKQRLIIARALYRGSKLLILDEPTSNLDQENENFIVETLESLSGKDLTIFIIAHRTTTLSACNTIYKIENGTLKIKKI